MKKIVLIFIAVVNFGIIANAQDAIILGNGNEVQYDASSKDLKIEFNRIDTDDRAMLDFFRRNNFTEYYNRFSSACNMRRTGATLLGTGLGLMGGGVIFMIVGLSTYRYGTLIAGYALIVVGEGLTIASIPVSAVAGGRKRAIKNDFERQYFGANAYIYQPTLNFGITQSGGAGFTFKF